MEEENDEWIGKKIKGFGGRRRHRLVACGGCFFIRDAER